MAAIEWLKIKNVLIDMSKVEHVSLLKSRKSDTPSSDVDAAISFNIEHRYYYVSFDSDEEAENIFNDIWSMM